jgi:hypothetical protein
MFFIFALLSALFLFSLPMLISIPTTAFAKKVILAEHNIFVNARHPNAILSINDDDELFDELRYNRTLIQTLRAEMTLTDTLMLDVPNSLSKQIGELYAVGQRLDKYAKGLMCRDMATMMKAGIPRYVALETFFQERNLDEWDFSKEAAIKRFQRYQIKKKSSNFRTKNVFNVPTNCDILNVKKSNVSTVSNTQLEAVAHNYESQYPSVFKGSQGRDLKIARKHLRIWIYLRIGGHSANNTAIHYRISLRTVYDACAAFAALVHQKGKPFPILSAEIALSGA